MAFPQATDELVARSDVLGIRYADLLALLDSRRMPTSLRRACCDLLLALYVDREPQVRGGGKDAP